VCDRPTTTDRWLVYRDISLENLVISRDGKARLIDMGSSFVVDKDGICHDEHYSFMGKLTYMPPELALDRTVRVNLYAVDVWALGLCLFMMLTGHPLYEDIWDAYYRKHLICLSHNAYFLVQQCHAAPRKGPKHCRTKEEITFVRKKVLRLTVPRANGRAHRRAGTAFGELWTDIVQWSARSGLWHAAARAFDTAYARPNP
jgi:serine/threonine protein kinase